MAKTSDSPGAHAGAARLGLALAALGVTMLLAGCASPYGGPGPGSAGGTPTAVGTADRQGGGGSHY